MITPKMIRRVNPAVMTCVAHHGVIINVVNLYAAQVVPPDTIMLITNGAAVQQEHLSQVSVF